MDKKNGDLQLKQIILIIAIGLRSALNPFSNACGKIWYLFVPRAFSLHWPSSIVARAEVKQFTGGGISPKTLANADSEGSGPAGRFFIGRRVCYTMLLSSNGSDKIRKGWNRQKFKVRLLSV